MADVLLSGMLDLTGTLDLVPHRGGQVKAGGAAVLVQVGRGAAGKAQGQAPAPVPIPPPPAAPADPGLDVWVFRAFNATVKANGLPIVTQGMCAQGQPGTATWPGMVQASLGNQTVKANGIAMNV